MEKGFDIEDGDSSDESYRRRKKQPKANLSNYYNKKEIDT